MALFVQISCLLSLLISVLFSETLLLVRACKRNKNVPSAFFEKFPFFPFWPKIGHIGPKCQKMEVFRIFLTIHSLEFAIFCFKPSLWSRKILLFHFFGEN